MDVTAQANKIANGKLSEEELQNLKEEASQILALRRKAMLFMYPFIGSIALRMDIVPVRDFRVRTACTDGDSIYFDIAFLNSLKPEEQKFVLAHEVWHAALMHMTRKQSRDADLFNIATDKEVNYLLLNDGFTVPNFALLPDEDEKGKSAEEIYEMLLKKMKQTKNSSMPSSGHGGLGESSSGSSDELSKQGGLSRKQFDKHVYNDDVEPEVDDEGNLKTGITDQWGDVGIDKDFRPKVSKDFADRMREAIVSSSQMAEKMMKGDLPANVKALVAKIMNPEISWEELLAQFVTQCYNGSKKSWLPPNRRHVYNDVYVQSRRSEKIKIAVGIDTSGSTRADRGKFLGELQGLVRTFGAYEITLIECDAEVGAVKRCTEDDELDNEINNAEYSMTGGGGTAMMPIFEYIRDNHLDVDAVCIMTDGYIDHIPENPLGLPVIWLITNDGDMDFCDWGTKVKFKNKKF